MSSSLSIQSITDAAIAQYIHEISARHRSRSPEARPRRGAHRSSEAAASKRRTSRRLALVEAGLEAARGDDRPRPGRRLSIEAALGRPLSA